jgi:cytosine/uracil/thiamine/allantoin permease
MSHESFMSEARLPDGRVELRDRARIEASPLYNHDLAPVAIARRTWTTYNYAALWISMAHCIPTYMLASGLIASGMNWWQALLTVGLGNTIVLIPILLNSHPGTKYGIPFPVFARAAYGTIGSNLPALMRGSAAKRSTRFLRTSFPAGPHCSGRAPAGTRRRSGSRFCCSGD